MKCDVSTDGNMNEKFIILRDHPFEGWTHFGHSRINYTCRNINSMIKLAYC